MSDSQRSVGERLDNASRVVGLTINEVAARMSTPVGVVRVLVGDLADAGYVQVRSAPEKAEHRDVTLLERLLEGIRAL